MPFDIKHYPKNWKAISASIRARSGGRCECTKECKKHVGRCDAQNYQPHPVTKSKVIFTVAHLGIKLANGEPGDKENKMDVRRRNLKAMCNYCHLNFDRDQHMKNARATRRRKIIAAGQLELQLSWAVEMRSEKRPIL